MATKVLVVGGAGFIGSHLSQALVDQDFDVHVLDNLSGGRRERVPSGATLHIADICNLAAIKPLFEKVDTVFHLAALPRVPYSIEYPIETNEANITGTLNVLLAARDAGVRRLIYSASSSAYGDQSTLPLTEGMKAEPKHPYGVQKYVGEIYTRVFSEVYNLSTVSLRYFNVYGPGQSADGPYAAAIVKFIEQRLAREPITVVGDGSQTRDFTHVSDVVRANILAMESPSVGKGEVINIGAGRNFSIAQIAGIIGGDIAYLPARPEAQHSLADISKAESLLGWKPQVSLEEGLAELKNLAGLS